MPRVDFYLIATSDDSKDSISHFACRLAEKAYKQHHRLYLHCRDLPHSHQLDNLLWTYKDESFIPHHLVGEGPNAAPPIQVGYNKLPSHREILLNLSEDVPGCYHEFQRIIEIVLDTPEHREKSREHFRFYREKGCTLNSHDVRQSQEP